MTEENVFSESRQDKALKYREFIKNLENQIIACGITRFSKNELLRAQGKQDDEILAIFPGKNRSEVIHRDHIAPI